MPHVHPLRPPCAEHQLVTQPLTSLPKAPHPVPASNASAWASRSSWWCRLFGGWSHKLFQKRRVCASHRVSMSILPNSAISASVGTLSGNRQMRRM